MKLAIRISIAVAALLALAFAGLMIWAYLPVPGFAPHAYTPKPPSHWPTEAWQRSSPEQQGMDRETLQDMVTQVKTRTEADPDFFIDSITVIRNGTIVAEMYPNPNFPAGELHVIHSATKSIISALVGIAIERGLIESVDARLVDFFPERALQNLDARKTAITIGDLLSMQTGLHSRDSYLYGHEGLLALQQSDDWLQFALDLPMAAEPGTRFDYSNISTFLLGAVLAKTTRTDVLAFAREALFDPLGIKDVRWEWTESNIPIAWARMWLKPDDLAKIGLLYMQHGKWDGQQIIPRSWITQSLTPHAFPGNIVDILEADMTRNADLSRRNWVAQRFIRPFADGYGYQWWLDRDGAYTALGTHGQYLMIAPEQNVIFVVTGKSRGIAQFEPATLFYDFVLPAVSDTPPPNEDAGTIVVMASPAPRTPAAITGAPSVRQEIVSAVSGITYRMERNPYNTDNIRLVFSDDLRSVVFSYTAREDWRPRFTVGLDGTPRRSKNETGAYVAHGTWTSPTALQINVEIVGYTTFDWWDLEFAPDGLTVTEHSITGAYTYRGRSAEDLDTVPPNERDSQ